MTELDPVKALDLLNAAIEVKNFHANNEILLRAELAAKQREIAAKDARIAQLEAKIANAKEMKSFEKEDMHGLAEAVNSCPQPVNGAGTAN